MKNTSPYRRVALILTLVIPAVMLVSVSPRLNTPAAGNAPASAQASTIYTLPEASARSRGSNLDAALKGASDAGVNLGGNYAPAAGDIAIDPAAVADVPPAGADVAPPGQDDCPKCSDRPRRTRTPKMTPAATSTAVAQPTDTPVVLPTNTPVVLPTNTATPTSAPPPPTWTPVLATATVVPNYHEPSPAVAAAEAQMYQLINAHRASIGLNQWARVTSLDLAERDWALQMVATNQCYHGDFGGRAAAEGYAGFAWGEVGACGYPTAQDAFNGWMNSPGHRAILEAGTDMDDVGIGAWQYPNGYFQFWAAVGDSH